MEFSPMFVVAMATRYSQACHVQRSVAAARLQTHNGSQLLTIGGNSLCSQSVRKEVGPEKKHRARRLAFPPPLCHCRAIIIKITLNSHEFTHSQTLSKKVQEFKEPRGSKRGLVLNLCLLNLEMTPFLDIILFWPWQIKSCWLAPASEAIQHHERWLGAKRSHLLWHCSEK